jgi:hypothetical protein
VNAPPDSNVQVARATSDQGANQMKKLDRMVLVVARDGADLVKLSSSGSPMSVPCGLMGPIIATKVRDAGGQALISVGDIRVAIDTTDGLNAVLDNFDLLDERTRGPLLHLLMKNL